MSDTYRLQWDRELHGPRAGETRLRYRRRGGDWIEVGSIEDLPDAVRAAYERARGLEATTTRRRTSAEYARRVKRRSPVQAREIDRTLYIDHPWFNGCSVVMFLIAVPYLAYLSWQDVGQGGWQGLLGGSMLALTAGLTYYGLCLLVNSTEFQVDNEFLKVSHGPLPWYGNRRIPVKDIIQLSTRMHRSRHDLHYSIYATLRNGGVVRVLEYADTEAEARSIERAIERHLGIEDWDS
ncbi:MAG: hypothetical protein R3C02_16880 [Planctomycetaceae bacterium]